jgi:hypothetical protein
MEKGMMMMEKLIMLIVTGLLFVMSLIACLMNAKLRECRGDYPQTADPLLMIVTVMLGGMFVLGLVKGVG